MPGAGEPLWLPEDADKAIAYEAEIRRACPGCHCPPEDVYDDDGEPHSPPLVEPALRTCPVCRAAAHLRDAVAKKPDLASAALYFRDFDPFSPVVQSANGNGRPEPLGGKGWAIDDEE
jgi:hypothetical protein